MRHTVLALIGATMMAAPAWADVKMTQNVSGRGAGGTGVTTSYIKGAKMRSDVVIGGTTHTTIFDVENQKMYIFDSKKKEVDVWDMADFSKQLGTTVEVTGMTATLTPNGQTKEILGRTATGYDMNITMPANIGGKEDGSGLKMTVAMTGQVWIAKGAPGTEDYTRFYQAAVEKGFIFTDPRAAKGASGQARATTEMYKQFAATGGVPYETETNVKMSGEGPMAGLLSRMGNVSSTSTVTEVDTATLDAALFAPPAGYKLNAKK